MSKTLKILISVLVLISITISAFIIFEWEPFTRKEKDILTKESLVQPLSSSEEIFEPGLTITTLPPVPIFNLPVEKKYFDDAFSRNKVSFLIFNLETGTEIYPIFSGEVLTSGKLPEIEHPVGKDPESNFIWISNKDGLKAQYLFLGDNLIKEGDIIKEDTILGRVTASEEGFVIYKNTNFSLTVFNEKGETIELSKDLFLND